MVGVLSHPVGNQKLIAAFRSLWNVSRNTRSWCERHPSLLSHAQLLAGPLMVPLLAKAWSFAMLCVIPLLALLVTHSSPYPF